ncbi:MAG: nitrate ABC transporter, permease protein [Methylotenera sp.]|nr:MAG: nitrate ABC transporter, permease protein [Methylotenera sp.]
MSAISVNKKHLKQIGEHVKTSSESMAKEPMLAANEDNTHMKMIIEKLAEKTQKPVKQQPSAMQIKVTEFFKAVIPPIFGILMFLGIWTLLSHQQPILPGPISTWYSAVELFSHPFHQNSLDDQGIGWNILSSLERVALGFGLAAIVGIPLGFMIGRYEFMSRMTAPVISLLRPVSPLAWLPLGLLVMGAAGPAAIWVIFISSIWPMVINTAVGVSKVPQDYMNVAKVLNLSEWKIITKISFPYVLPYMMTGVRLSIGIAWLVIVAAEMLNGGAGIGFWLWDEYNASNYEHIIIAIFVVGIIGLLLELGLSMLAKRFAYE